MNINIDLLHAALEWRALAPQYLDIFIIVVKYDQYDHWRPVSHVTGRSEPTVRFVWP